MSLRQRVHKSLGVTPLRAASQRALKHSGPGEHPSGSSQDVHGNWAGNRTLVGITSARPGTPPRKVFTDLREFEKAFKRLKGVKSVSIQPGLGAWEGGSEPTWVVSYRGNGEATRLLAQTGKQYDQDGVLMLKGTKAGQGSPVNEIEFGQALTPSVRNAIHSILSSNGFGGWTWFKRNGKAVLRLAYIPQWSGDRTADQHLSSVKTVIESLEAAGMTVSETQLEAVVEIMERGDGEYGYDTILGGGNVH